MKLNQYILITCLLMATFFIHSCYDFADLQDDPNQSTVASPEQLLTGIILKTMQYNPLYGDFSPAAQYFGSYSSQQAKNQGYNWAAAPSDTMYVALRNVNRMTLEAAKVNGKAYFPIAKFFKAYCYIEASIQVGDIPMSQSMQADQNILEPVYDTQKDVFKESLKLLDEANTEMAAYIVENGNVKFGNDLLYGGDPAKWQKLINSYTIRVLVHLSKKVNDADLNVKSKFAAIVNDPAKYPVFTDNADNAVFTWYDKEGNRYPRYYVVATLDYYRVGKIYMDYLKQYNDPRIKVVASISSNAAAAGKTADDMSAYGGIDIGASFEYNNSIKDDASMINKDRYTTAVGEPMIIVGYPELCFNIAEGIQRGWLTGKSADEYYKAGITASMSSYYTTQVNAGDRTRCITDTQISAYLQQATVAYNNNLDQILIQKYIAFFNNSGFQSYYNIRRTGIPALSIGAGNENGGRIPKRWLYPNEESQLNKANLDAALQRQYGGADDINASMWLIKD